MAKERLAEASNLGGPHPRGSDPPRAASARKRELFGKEHRQRYKHYPNQHTHGGPYPGGPWGPAFTEAGRVLHTRVGRSYTKADHEEESRKVQI